MRSSRCSAGSSAEEGDPDHRRPGRGGGDRVASLGIVVRRVAGEGRQATELTHRIVPKSTLQRRHDRLSPDESQRLERLARLTALAERVWDDPEPAHEFLVSPQPQLGGERPADLIRTDLGTRRVEDLLWSLEYSLPV